MTYYTRDEVIQRKNFYRDHYRTSVKLLLGTLVILAILLMAIAYLVLFKPEPLYYATASDGGLMSLSAYDAPNESSTSLIE